MVLALMVTVSERGSGPGCDDGDHSPSDNIPWQYNNIGPSNCPSHGSIDDRNDLCLFTF